MLSWKRKGCLMTNINVPCISKGASFSNWNKFFTLVTGMWTDQIIFKFRKIIRAPILPVFKPTVLLPDLQTAVSSRSLAGSAIAHIWKSWDLTADESRMQSKLIKPVWSQEQQRQGRSSFQLQTCFWQLILYLCGFGNKRDYSFFACFRNAPVCRKGDGSRQTISQTQQSTFL